MLNFTPWDASAGAPPLAAESLHLWRIQAGPDGEDPAVLWPLLSPAEQARAERLATSALRDRYVRAHGCLRLILSKYLKKQPQDIVFTISKQGKPSAFQSSDGLHQRVEFNLTGSHDLALVAVAPDRPIGVDCELIRPRRELLGIARRMFSRQVADALESTREPQRLDAFYAAWTALEAQVKADGRGLFRPRDPGPPRFSTAHFRPQSGYIAAVAGEQLPADHLWGGYEWSGSGRCRTSAIPALTGLNTR
jgi:4'-phosphopantetheinyl transferase